MPTASRPARRPAPGRGCPRPGRRVAAGPAESASGDRASLPCAARRTPRRRSARPPGRRAAGGSRAMSRWLAPRPSASTASSGDAPRSRRTRRRASGGAPRGARRTRGAARGRAPATGRRSPRCSDARGGAPGRRSIRRRAPASRTVTVTGVSSHGLVRGAPACRPARRRPSWRSTEAASARYVPRNSSSAAVDCVAASMPDPAPAAPASARCRRRRTSRSRRPSRTSASYSFSVGD